MSTSLLYHTQCVVGFQHECFEFSEGKVIQHIKRQKIKCPCCRHESISAYPLRERMVQSLPYGNKPTFLKFTVHRIYCPRCGKEYVERFHFLSHPESRHDLDGLSLAMQRGGVKSLYELPQQLKIINEEKGHFDVIIIDALYKALPKDIDENSNGQITGIYNLIERIAREQKAAIVLVHHTSKGNQANKSVTDVGSGAGAQSRAPDTHLALRPHREKGVVSVSCCVRSFRSVDPFCIKRDDNYLWVTAPEYEPNDLEGKDASSGQGKEEPTTVEDISATIEYNLGNLDLPLGKTCLVEKLKSRINVSKTKIISALEDLCKNKVLEIRKGDYAKGQQASKLFYHGPNSPFYQPLEETSDSSE